MRPPTAGVPPRRRRMAAAWMVVALTVGACGAPEARQDGARQAGRVFEAALAAGDEGRACDLLAPQTRQQLEQSGQQGCAQALAAQRLPVAGSVRDVEAYGRQAMVRMSGDTLLLSLFGNGWKVVAAYCAPRPGQPYDCRVKGA